jgi:hypothetical protein
VKNKENISEPNWNWRKKKERNQTQLNKTGTQKKKSEQDIQTRKEIRKFSK